MIKPFYWYDWNPFWNINLHVFQCIVWFITKTISFHFFSLSHVFCIYIYTVNWLFWWEKVLFWCAYWVCKQERSKSFWNVKWIRSTCSCWKFLLHRLRGYLFIFCCLMGVFITKRKPALRYVYRWGSSQLPSYYQIVYIRTLYSHEMKSLINGELEERRF